MKKPRSRPIRFELDLRRRRIASVPIFGCYHYAHAMPGLAPHRHPGAIEICFLARGRQIYEVDGHRYCLRGGDLFLTFPGEDHGTGREPEEKGHLFWVVVLDPALTRDSLLGLPPDESKVLWAALLRMRHSGPRHFAARPGLKASLDALTELVFRKRTPLLGLTTKTRLVTFLLEVVASHANAVREPDQQTFEAIFREIEAQIDSPELLTIGKLAAIVGLSKSRFQAKFKAETGIPPAEFVLRARVAEAERRLARGGTTVTRVAYDLGFSTSQYFSVAFRRFTNRCPSEVSARSEAVPRWQVSRPRF